MDRYWLKKATPKWIEMEVMSLLKEMVVAWEDNMPKGSTFINSMLSRKGAETGFVNLEGYINLTRKSREIGAFLNVSFWENGKQNSTVKFWTEVEDMSERGVGKGLKGMLGRELQEAIRDARITYEISEKKVLSLLKDLENRLGDEGKEICQLTKLYLLEKERMRKEAKKVESALNKEKENLPVMLGERPFKVEADWYGGNEVKFGMTSANGFNFIFQQKSSEEVMERIKDLREKEESVSRMEVEIKGRLKLEEQAGVLPSILNKGWHLSLSAKDPYEEVSLIMDREQRVSVGTIEDMVEKIEERLLNYAMMFESDETALALREKADFSQIRGGVAVKRKVI